MFKDLTFLGLDKSAIFWNIGFMRKIEFNLEKRKEIENKLVEARMPRVTYPFYAVYLHSYGGPYTVGFQTQVAAEAFRSDHAQYSKSLLDIRLTEGYPYEIMNL